MVCIAITISRSWSDFEDCMDRDRNHPEMAAATMTDRIATYAFCIRAKRTANNRMRAPVRIAIVVAYLLRIINPSRALISHQIEALRVVITYRDAEAL